ncbi:MAG: hypothetical protein IT456_08275 [Planctomycetes bacterium]|nr:hypothetical protein [Planctomycetota bacterium]
MKPITPLVTAPFFALPVVLLAIGTLAGCRGVPSPEPTIALPTVMPRLRGTTFLPLRPSPAFHSGWGSVTVEGDHPPVPASEPPFATDAEAEQVLRGWLTQNFGPLPPDTELRMTNVLHSASGSDVARFDWDQGHTITFRQTWRGFLTDRFAVLYLQGRSKVHGTVDLARFTVIPGSEARILDEAEAREQFAQVLRSMGQDTAMVRDCSMHLEFLYATGDETSCELRPVWMIGDGPGFLDAVTGQPGRNG